MSFLMVLIFMVANSSTNVEERNIGNNSKTPIYNPDTGDVSTMLWEVEKKIFMDQTNWNEEKKDWNEEMKDFLAFKQRIKDKPYYYNYILNDEEKRLLKAWYKKLCVLRECHTRLAELATNKEKQKDLMKISLEDWNDFLDRKQADKKVKFSDRELETFLNLQHVKFYSVRILLLTWLATARAFFPVTSLVT